MTIAGSHGVVWLAEPSSMGSNRRRPDAIGITARMRYRHGR